MYGGRSQIALDLRVDDNDRDLRKRDWFCLKAAAIDEQRMAWNTERGRELVHDAALHTDEGVLSLLAEERKRRAIESAPGLTADERAGDGKL